MKEVAAAFSRYDRVRDRLDDVGVRVDVEETRDQSPNVRVHRRRILAECVDRDGARGVVSDPVKVHEIANATGDFPAVSLQQLSGAALEVACPLRESERGDQFSEFVGGGRDDALRCG